MKNVIISGADGFVGSYTTKYFLEKGCHVLALGRKTTPSRLQPAGNLIYLPFDVSAPEVMLEQISMRGGV